ncbi:MAG: Ig-like domain-containing protein [Limisphaerales bacterium]|jgi:hypothetical protein
MKTIRSRAIGTAACLLFATAVHTYAIEGLQLSLQCSNVVLTWPSVEGETYIVQYRPTLDTNSTWQTLTNFMPAETGVSMTTFVHSNVVQMPNCDGGSFAAMSYGGESSLMVVAVEDDTPTEPMVISTNGTGEATPLQLYPPGFDLSGFYIYDPRSEELVSGSAFMQAASELDFPEPEEGEGSGEGGTNFVSETGFYRVVRNGVHFYGLTNGVVLSDVVTIPIELSLTNADTITGMSFYTDDGSPLVGANDSENAPWVLEWDTRMVPNGTYSIYAEVNFASDASVTNEPISVTVSNFVSFPNYFTRNFEDWMWLYAELATPEADYEIAMYADETNYLGSFFGSTSDGVISFLWDLTDGQSYTFTNDTFSAEYIITPTSSSFGPQQNGPQTTVTATNFWAREYAWKGSGIGKFVVAYSPLDNNGTKTLKIGLMVSGGTGGEYGGVTQTLGSYGLGPYQLSPGNQQGSAFQMYDGTTKTNLLSYLWDVSYRNFYYFGHGSPSAVGGAPGTTVPTITARDFRRVLYNFPSSGKPLNAHPYRLVFFDGCRVGAGNMCEQFGIPTQTTDNNFFLYSGVRSRAFFGFKDTISFNEQQWTWRSLMIGGFFADWISGQPLFSCATNAVAGGHSSGYQSMDTSWIIRGATNLQINTVP